MNGPETGKIRGGVLVLDNNFADRDGMRTYLAASSANKAAISETVFEEWFKAGKAEEVTRRVQRIACEFPKQIVILRSPINLLHMSGGSRGFLLHLIDRQQTRAFSAYCDTVINAPMTAELEAHFKTHREDVRDALRSLLPEAHKLMRRYAAWDNEFTDKQKQELNGLLKRQVPLSGELQHVLCCKAFEMGSRLFYAHEADKSGLPTSDREAVNLLAVRYGVMAVALYVRLRNQPGTDPTNDGKVLNHLMDVKIAAQASYLDGFLTHEPDLEVVFQLGLSLIKALGGYTGCGASGQSPVLASNLASVCA